MATLLSLILSYALTPTATSMIPDSLKLVERYLIVVCSPGNLAKQETRYFLHMVPGSDLVSQRAKDVALVHAHGLFRGNENRRCPAQRFFVDLLPGTGFVAVCNRSDVTSLLQPFAVENRRPRISCRNNDIGSFQSFFRARCRVELELPIRGSFSRRRRDDELPLGLKTSARCQSSDGR